MHSQEPPVIRLEAHLEDENLITFKDEEKLTNIQRRNKLSKLTAWFLLNQTDLDANKYLYQDIPKYYVWKSVERVWKKRKHNKISKMIGRMHFINPSDTERFSMRLLLLNTPGATSFKQLRTHKGICYEYYQAAAIERGLLADDKIWNLTLTEAALIQTDIHKFRNLFALILIFGNPSNPGQLWINHKDTLASDILYKERMRLNNQSLQINEEITNETLFCLDEIIKKNSKKDLSHFRGIPTIPYDYLPANVVVNKYLREHLSYDKVTLKEFVNECKNKLNTQQKDIYNRVTNLNNDSNSDSKLFFIDGPGGNYSYRNI